MYYYSTNNKNLKISFEDAVMKGMPDDGGLFMPYEILSVDKEFLKRLPGLDYRETAFYLASLFLDDFPKDDLKKIIYDAYNFEPPVIFLDNKIFSNSDNILSFILHNLKSRSDFSAILSE